MRAKEREPALPAYTRKTENRQRLFILLLCITLLLLCGCGVQESADDAALGEKQEETAPTPEPTPTPVPELAFPDGSVHLADETELDLSGLKHEDVEATAELLVRMPELKTVDLGSEMPEVSEEETKETEDADTEEKPEAHAEPEEPEEPVLEEEPEPQLPERRDLTWQDICRLQEAAPQADVCYRFTLFEKEFTTLDEEMNFHHVTMDDEGAAVKEVLPCMTKCKFLNMDFCGVSSESMAAIRDAYPEMEVVWRIWFGTDCSVRTDVERILASNLNHKLQDQNTQDLKYCTKVRLLDIGHNTLLHDFSFLEYMPDLEVAIVCITGLEDLTPLSGCTKLEYLEINTLKEGMDLSPLGSLTNLEHLCACYLGHVTGWEALENLTKLKRLWFGRFTYLPEGALEELQAALPDTVINTTNTFGCSGDWRHDSSGYTERYALLKQQFEYDNYGRVSSSWYNDPEYFKEGEYHYRPRW